MSKHKPAVTFHRAGQKKTSRNHNEADEKKALSNYIKSNNFTEFKRVLSGNFELASPRDSGLEKRTIVHDIIKESISLCDEDCRHTEKCEGRWKLFATKALKMLTISQDMQIYQRHKDIINNIFAVRLVVEDNDKQYGLSIEQLLPVRKRRFFKEELVTERKQETISIPHANHLQYALCLWVKEFFSEEINDKQKAKLALAIADRFEILFKWYKENKKEFSDDFLENLIHVGKNAVVTEILNKMVGKDWVKPAQVAQLLVISLIKRLDYHSSPKTASPLSKLLELKPDLNIDCRAPGYSNLGGLLHVALFFVKIETLRKLCLHIRTHITPADFGDAKKNPFRKRLIEGQTPLHLALQGVPNYLKLGRPRRWVDPKVIRILLEHDEFPGALMERHLGLSSLALFVSNLQQKNCTKNIIALLLKNSQDKRALVTNWREVEAKTEAKEERSDEFYHGNVLHITATLGHYHATYELLDYNYKDGGNIREELMDAKNHFHQTPEFIAASMGFKESEELFRQARIGQKDFFNKENKNTVCDTSDIVGYDPEQYRSQLLKIIKISDAELLSCLDYCVLLVNIFAATSKTAGQFFEEEKPELIFDIISTLVYAFTLFRLGYLCLKEIYKFHITRAYVLTTLSRQNIWNDVLLDNPNLFQLRRFYYDKCLGQSAQSTKTLLKKDFNKSTYCYWILLGIVLLGHIFSSFFFQIFTCVDNEDMNFKVGTAISASFFSLLGTSYVMMQKTRMLNAREACKKGELQLQNFYENLAIPRGFVA